ncbi:MAG: isocitrate lyase/PEP mutase family protein [Gaiellaceae bacterium]
MTVGSTLRGYLADGESRLIVSAYDALTAKVAEAAGVEVLHLTGFGASAAMGGTPDIGLLSLTEMVDACRRICDATEAPVLADADTGHGNPLNVRRTIREFEAAGAAGVHLEDQVAPKRCGHMAGKSVIPAADMVAKVKAAVDARRDDDFVIMARTDANAVEGLDAALERAALYVDAGADMIFVEAPRDEQEIERIAREVSVPQLFNWTFGALTPHFDRARLAKLGFELVLFSDVASVVHFALSAFHGRLVAAESLDEIADSITGFDDFNSFIGLPEWRALEQRYADA